MPRVPDLRAARRVLCVQPHYDDNDIGAGGTLAALAGAGAELHYLTVTDDLVGVLDASLSDAEATANLRSEQRTAGAEIGVTSQTWLGFPDAGRYDYFDLRTGIVREIRRVRPDFLMTVDPELPNEAHRDHRIVARATAESLLLYHFPRLKTDPAVDAAYERHDVRGIAFYFTTAPNQVIDTTGTRQAKYRALRAYRSQFTAEGLEQLVKGLERKEQEWAATEAFSHGEGLRVLSRRHLHVNLDTGEH